MSTEDDRDEKLIGSSSDTWIILGPRSHSDEESLYSPPPYFPLNNDESYPVWSPSFDIVFNYTDGNTSYSAAANAAAAFWELAITADLPDAGGVDDLRIDSHLGLIDRASDGEGNVLANAGPRSTRAGSNLPYTGEMGIDPPDADNPALVAIIVHEIGHVLGLPFVGRQRNLVQDIGAETRFVGTAALAEYRTLANNTALTFVPMQGNQGGHWDEGTFGVELLTPSINTSQFAPLSRMSLAAMRDLGYTVDLGYADPFALGATLSQFRDDRSGNFNSSATVAVNGSVTGAIELAEDNDWYRVSLTAGTIYTFELNGSATDSGTLADPFLALRSLDGGILASNDDGGTGRNARIAYTAAATGTYFLDASAFGTGTGSYTLRALLGDGSAGTVAIDDVSVTEGENGTRLANFTVTRTGGSAAFSVAYATADGTARAGSDYRAASGSLSFADGQNSATVSVVVNGDGDVEPDETFFVNLSGATGGATIADSQGRGTIRNDDTAPRNDDYANGLDDPDRPFGAVRLGGVATGTLEQAGDRDWFRVRLTAGQSYVMQVSGLGSEAGSLVDAYLRVYTSAGAVTAENDDSGPGRDARVSFTAQTSGTYYLEAGAYRDAAPGTYQVSVDPLLRPDPDGNPLVYDSYYLAANPDVAAAGLDPDAHYAQYGWREGRDPNPFFSTNGYRAANGDVRAAGINPLDHYAQYGWREGRDPSARFDDELYLARNADVRAAGLNPLDHFIRYGQAEGRESYAAVGRAGDIGPRNGFDAAYYLLANPDVAAAALITGGDGFAFALNHYRTNGWREGRDPNAVFDTRGYLNAYADVRAAGLDPLEHYDRYGWREGRDPSATFDTSAYLAAYADVRAANLDPLVHYLQNGRLEGRSPFADGSFGRDQTG